MIHDHNHARRPQWNAGPGSPSERECGLTLLEITVALSVFIVLILSVSLTLVRGMEHRHESFQLYRGQSALRTLIADIQETANLPQDIQAQQGIGALYGKYHGQTFPVSELPSGQISVLIFANETSVPTFLGGPQDLNFDSDAQDNLQSSAAGPDLKLAPMELTLTFVEKGAGHSMKVRRLITRTSGR